MLRTENLSKSYDGHVAVQGLNLNVRAGEIYGFLGPNGAGKTTTIRLLLGLLQPTAGEIFLFERPITHDPLTLKQRLGVVAEEPMVATRMTAWEFVRYFAGLNGVAQPEGRMEMLFQTLGLWSARHALAAAYSRGMRQKLSLIRAMVHQPDLLILDEPVSGLDPHSILQVRGVIDQHRDAGGAVLISSHILSEVERSADRIGILHNGRLLIEDTMSGIRARLGSNNIIHLTLAAQSPTLTEKLQNIPEVQNVELRQQQGTQQIAIQVAGTRDARPDIFRAVVAADAVLLEMALEEMSLEEAFVTITNQNVEQLAGTK